MCVFSLSFIIYPQPLNKKKQVTTINVKRETKGTDINPPSIQHRDIRVYLNGFDDWFYLDEIDRYFEDAIKKAEEVMDME